MRESFPNSEAAQDHCIILPLYPQMSEAEHLSVIGELKSAIYAVPTGIPRNDKYNNNGERIDG